ncbi:OPT family oligopeptide transporter [Mesoterricola sediminis]|uniref:Oligopeptide transporter, OPT family protein n=1 Tax=Mesoterricola sediminis TaxID=2927980 RepID=A0AA48H972_9BACT|nr:oligopeptide transporter, OPT family [Mesoterricola sediminis]BDU78238.1 oligopeptide transporter, OPT family protein [Mesoterricola sediminis]
MQPYVSSDQNLREFSLRAVLIGLVLAVVLGAANAYLGLKAGMTIAATYPAAVISMALIKLMKGTILEENMGRTVGSIGESVAAGAIFTIPAFVISGIWPKFFSAANYLTSTAIMFVGGTLGIMFVALLRRVMVEDAELPYPESVAAAEIHKAGAKGGGGTKILFTAMGVGAAIQALVQVQLFSSFWQEFVYFKENAFTLIGKGKAALAKGGIYLTAPGISPAYMGVGYIIGPKLGALNFAGGILAWGLMVPLIIYFIAPYAMPAEATKADWFALSAAVWKFIVRPIAIGGMLVGAGYTLFRMRKSLTTGLARSVSDVKKAAAGEGSIDRVNQDLPFTWVLMGIVGAAVATFLITWQVFHLTFMVSVVAALVMVIVGFFFSAISGYLVGIMGSSNNPISGLTLSALVVTAIIMVALGVKGQAGVAAVLGVAAIACVATAVAGEMLQDLKVGYILGGTPWRMQVGDILGVGLAAAVLFLPLMILHEGDIKKVGEAQIVQLEKQNIKSVTYGEQTYTIEQLRQLPADQKKVVMQLDAGFGSPNIPAPQAGLMAMLSKGIVEGKMAWPLIIVGMLMGFAFILMQVRSPMLVSVGMYLPLGTTFAIFLGGCVKGIVDMIAEKRGLNEAQKVRVENTGVLVSAGLIAGEALVGLAFAALTFFEVKYTIFADPARITFLVSLAILVAIGIYLVRLPLAHAGEADEPAPPSANF